MKGYAAPSGYTENTGATRAACAPCRLTAQLRRDTPVPAPPSAPPAKKVARRLLTGDLADNDRATLGQITARCTELTATRDLVREFADMLCHRYGEHLEAWGQPSRGQSCQRAARLYQRVPGGHWAAVTVGLTVS